MSWLDQLQTEFTITMGDGAVFSPLWINASKAIEYNVAEFDFPKLDGTLVDRSTVRGARYNVEIMFQGDDHLDVSNSFEVSGRDKRAWTLGHPYYGNIIVQPLGMVKDNAVYNQTRIMVTVVETITQDAPRITQDPVDKIIFDKEQLDSTNIASFDIVKPSVQDVNTMAAMNNSLYATGSKKAKNPLDAEAYFNSFNTANAAINNATADPLSAIQAAIAVVNAPSQFQISVQSRMALLTNQFANLVKMVRVSSSRSTKKIFELNATALISAMAAALGLPQDNDFTNRASVISLTEALLFNYNQYILTLDSIQTENGGSPESYIPDDGAITGLTDLVKYTISNLFVIAMGAKQERTFFLEDDSNVILLTHRLYGISEDDATIDQFIQINNIGLNEMVNIRKGRQITYYV